MIDKIKQLQDKNKLLKYVLLPILGVAIVITLIAKVLGDFNILGAKKDIQEAEKKDIDLAKEQREAEEKAKQMQEEAKKHGEKAKEHENKADNVDVDEDWHLKE